MRDTGFICAWEPKLCGYGSETLAHLYTMAPLLLDTSLWEPKLCGSGSETLTHLYTMASFVHNGFICTQWLHLYTLASCVHNGSPCLAHVAAVFLLVSVIVLCFLPFPALLHLLRSRIHERTILLRFLGIFLRVLRLEVSVYMQCLHYKPGFKTLQPGGWGGEGGVKSVSRGDCE